MASEQYRYCLKIETDGIAATKVLVLVLYDLERDKIWSFADHPGQHPINTGLEIALLADEVIVHSDYALKTLDKLFFVTLDRSKIVDTLKMAEMLHGKGGYSIRAWAARLKIARDDFHGAQCWSPAVQRHAEREPATTNNRESRREELHHRSRRAALGG